MEEKLLEGRFFLFPSCQPRYDVIVTRQNLMFSEHIETPNRQPAKTFCSILMENIVGCRLYESKVKSDHFCCFKVIALMKDKNGQRCRQLFTFCVLQSKDKQENITIAETWAKTIAWLARDPRLTTEQLQEKDFFPPRKKFFILVNPKSGPGKSLELFKNIIEPLLQDALIDYQVFVTEYGGHCRNMVKNFNYAEYDAVVICSGDGLVFEYINGLMQRSDWQEALQLAIGILPTGSGNALAASLCYAANEMFGLVNSLYVLLKGQKHPMDLFSAQTRQETMYGFLSVSWGLVSDVDIESEKFRKLGPLRFTVGALQRIMGLRHYHGTFHYLAADNNSGSSIESCNEIDANLDNGSSSPDVSDNIELNIKADAISSTAKENGRRTILGPKSSLPSLMLPLPDDGTWSEVDGEFILLSLSSLSHLASNMYASPGMFFNDGILDAQYVLRGTRKKTMLELLSAFETGKHIDYPDVKRLRLKAFRLVPHMERPGHVAVDGEEVQYGPIQGEIFPSVANIILKQ